MSQKGLTELMTVSPEGVSGKIVEFLRSLVKKEGKQGVVLGLSGGVDSGGGSHARGTGSGALQSARSLSLRP